VAVSRSRRLATGLDAALMALIVLVVAAVVVELAHRHRWQLDVSADALATLDPDTVAALALLEARDQTVTITAFGAQAKDDEAWLRDRMMRDFLRTLEGASERVHTQLVDFDRDRLTAERLGVDRYGTVVVEARGDRVDLLDRTLFRARGPKGQRDVTFVGEAPIAAAVREVLSDRTKTVLALAGHGEDEPYDRGLGELRELASRIDEQGIALRKLELLRDAGSSAPSIPADADAVLVLGAGAPLAGVEVDALRDYLGRGGAVAWFLDPGDPVPVLLEELGLSLPDGVVLDPKSYFPHVDRPILNYGRHEITEALARDGVAAVVSLARPIAVSPRDGVRASTLLQTSRLGWVERGTERPPAYNAEVDGAGPVVAGVAVTVDAPHPWMRPGAPSARVAVVGDVDLVRDELLAESPGNATLLANVLRWAVRTDEAFARVGRPGQIRRLALGASQLRVLRWLLMGGMPLLAAALGVGVLMSRRGR
jgi:hypothetical protein